jgi:hypothetical protein
MADAMWSMCQRYHLYPDVTSYEQYMRDAARSLNAKVAGLDR